MRRACRRSAIVGQLLETFVFQELRRDGELARRAIEFHHFRDKDGVEVDMVIERGAGKWRASK